MPDDHTKTVVVGLVGGIASGKSYVAEQLRLMGASVIDADQLAHDVLQKPLIVRTLLQKFGPEIADEQGGIDRARLAGCVFSTDPQAFPRRRELEALVHPMVHAEVIHHLKALNEREQGPPPMVVIDAPLLLEAGWHPMCDAIIFVDTPEAIRHARAAQRGWSVPDLQARERAQMPIAEKRSAATHVVDNRDEATVTSQLKDIWAQLIK